MMECNRVEYNREMQNIANAKIQGFCDAVVRINENRVVSDQKLTLFITRWRNI